MSAKLATVGVFRKTKNTKLKYSKTLLFWNCFLQYGPTTFLKIRCFEKNNY